MFTLTIYSTNKYRIGNYFASMNVLYEDIASTSIDGSAPTMHIMIKNQINAASGGKIKREFTELWVPHRICTVFYTSDEN